MPFSTAPAPETVNESRTAEYAAAMCRRISTQLLELSGPALREFLDGELSRARAVLDDPSLLGDGDPADPPVFDRKGRVRMYTSPVRSMRNGIAPGVRAVDRGDDAGGDVEFRVTLDRQYQGPPGAVHGGYCAVLLDEVLWQAVLDQIASVAFTGQLTISYLLPVPLSRELTVRGRVTETAGRKLFARGSIEVDGEVCATGEGVWIRPRER